jgi:hypothetical protein
MNVHHREHDVAVCCEDVHRKSIHGVGVLDGVVHEHELSSLNFIFLFYLRSNLNKSQCFNQMSLELFYTG